jgi:hypothetical protein
MFDVVTRDFVVTEECMGGWNRNSAARASWSEWWEMVILSFGSNQQSATNGRNRSVTIQR